MSSSAGGPHPRKWAPFPACPRSNCMRESCTYRGNRPRRSRVLLAAPGSGVWRAARGGARRPCCPPAAAALTRRSASSRLRPFPVPPASRSSEKWRCWPSTARSSYPRRRAATGPRPPPLRRWGGRSSARCCWAASARTTRPSRCALLPAPAALFPPQNLRTAVRAAADRRSAQPRPPLPLCPPAGVLQGRRRAGRRVCDRGHEGECQGARRQRQGRPPAAHGREAGSGGRRRLR